MIASLFDGADGLVARATKTSSVRGGYLDATLDRYADCIAFSALILCDWVNPLPIESLEFISGQMWAMAAMIGAFQTSYCRAAAERLGVSQEGISGHRYPSMQGTCEGGILRCAPCSSCSSSS